jgi:RND superfamily putative drug exporter
VRADGGGILSGLGSLVVALRYPILLAWLVGAVAATVYLPGLGGDAEQPLGGLVAEESEAAAAELRSIRAFEAPLLARSLVVQRDPRGLPGEALEAAARRAVAVSRGEVAALRGIGLAAPISNAGRLVPSASEDGTTIVTYLFFDPRESLPGQARLARAYAGSIPAGESPVGVTGAAPARYDQWTAISDSLPVIEVATVAFVALVFALAFRSPVVPLLVLAAGGIAYFVSVRLVGWSASALGTFAPRELEPLAIALLLGLVTDYAAFYVAGTRRRLALGDGRVAAVRATARSVTPIMATAGLIIALGTATMLFAKLEFFRAFAPGLALTVLVTAAVGLTFVPAALAVFGGVLFWPRHPEPGADDERPPRWRVLLVRVATVRAVSLLVVVAVVAGLVAAAWPLGSLRLGFGLIDAHPPGSEVRRAEAAAAAGFAPGIVAPTEILLEGPGVGRRGQALARLGALLSRRDAVAGVIGPADVPEGLPASLFRSKDGNAARLAVVLRHEPLRSEAIEELGALRADLPGMLEQAGLRGVRASLAGDTALAEETVGRLRGDFVRVAVAALVVNFLLLALFLRAVVAPLYLIAASAFALAASLGITTLVFGDVLGHGDLTYYVPFAVAVLSLSLGSDYNLFVAGRIWQEAATRPLREAVVHAAPRAARAISIAGITLAGSFGILGVIPLRSLREFAFAMAVGVLLDTFVVRPFLVPALVTLFGDGGFWPRRHAPSLVAGAGPEEDELAAKARA